jgi:hypothetical protein
MNPDVEPIRVLLVVDDRRKLVAEDRKLEPIAALSRQQLECHTRPARKWLDKQVWLEIVRGERGREVGGQPPLPAGVAERAQNHAFLNGLSLHVGSRQ